MKHKLFSFLLAVVVSAGTMNAEIKNGTCGTNLTWSLNTEDSTLTIQGIGAMSNYNISNNPAPWRQDSAYIKHLIFENGITSIGSYAFYNCINLISVTIPNSVESIGNYAFQFCSNLPFVTIPQNVTSIGKQAFRGCSGLKWFACQAVTPPTLGSDVFYGVHRKTPMFVPSASIDEYKNAAWWSEFVNYISSWGDCGDNLMWYLNTIDSTLTIQGTGAMTDYTWYSSVPWYSYRSSIKSISLPDGLTTIGGYAFSGCSALTSITIPNSVTSIGDEAFEGCTGLTSPVFNAHVFEFMPTSYSGAYTIPDGIESIASSAFYGCSGLTSVTIGNSVTSIGDEAFLGCSGLTSIIVENGNSVYDSRNNCNAIIETATNTLIVGCKNTIIPNSVTSIGGDAFYGCTGLTSVTIGNSVTSIGGYAFYKCSGLTSVTIGNSVTSIGTCAFSYCSSLTSVTIPNSVTSIGVGAFHDCTGLTSIIVENGNSVYDSRNNCNAIIETATNTLIVGCKNTIIPNSVTSIRNYAFQNCTGLTSVTIPNSVTSIGALAFSGCTGLTSVTIGDGVTSIGSQAFEGCTSLLDITCYATVVPSIDAGTFANMGNKQYVYLYVPSDRERAYKIDTYWEEFNIHIISATSTTTDVVKVVPTETTAAVTWPAVSGAATYDLVIKDKSGNAICTLIFNAQGQLKSITFAAPSVRNNTPEQIQQAGFEFTVNGLEPGTTYNYTVTSKNASGGTINVKNGTFTTLAPTGIEDVLANPSAAKDGKVLHDGQIYILRDGKVYDLTGKEIK